jgi:hypothetical protein
LSDVSGTPAAQLPPLSIGPTSACRRVVFRLGDGDERAVLQRAHRLIGGTVFHTLITGTTTPSFSPFIFGCSPAV